MSVLVLLDEVASALEQESDRVRIRKLIFCACRNRWENDKNALLHCDLPDLLLELYQKNSTVEKLTESLYKIVQQLNRKTEYSAIANTIISQLGTLYEEPEEEATQFVGVGDETQFIPLSSFSSPIREVARELEQHEETLRIRKLLFCTDRNQWENNPQVLLDLNLEQLLENIQHKYSTLQDLGAILERIVSSLNRKQEYTRIANLILDRLHSLYLNEGNSLHIALTEEEEDRTAIEEGYLEPQYPENPEPVTAATAYFPNGDRANHTQTQFDPQLDNQSSVLVLSPQPAPPQKASQTEDDTTNYTPTPDTDFTPVGKGDRSENNATSLSQTRDYDPFNVRLEVMKYANPLRAKILAFSTLHHKFEITSKEWSSVRTLSFDELLLNLYQNYPNLTALEKPLYETARGMQEPDESTQAAEAIVQAMKPYYQ